MRRSTPPVATSIVHRLLGITTDAGYLLLAALPALRGAYRRWAVPRYRGLAGRYAHHVRLDPAYFSPLRSILDILPIVPATVLEVGAGTGAATAVIADRYPASRLVAVDASPPMLAQFEHRSRSVHRVIGDAFALPVRRGSVDFVFAHNAPFDLGELMRAASPQGVVAVILSSATGIPVVVRSWCLRRSGARGWRYTEYRAGAGLALLFTRHPKP